MTPQERKVMELALEALKENQHLVADNQPHAYVMEYNSIIEKCEEALAQPKEQEQEPAAKEQIREAMIFNLPLYTTPPQPKQPEQKPVGVVINERVYSGFGEYRPVKTVQWRGTPPPAGVNVYTSPTVQRIALPDAITDDSESPQYRTGWNECLEAMKGMRKEALAQRPPQRKPMTDEEILTYRHMIDWTAEWSYINFARAIEAAHGIKREA